MKPITFFIIMLVISGTAYSQLTFNGIVRSEDQESVSGATVILSGQSQTTISTDINGEFKFLNLQPGRYTLKVSHIGYETLTEVINLTGGNTKPFIAVLIPESKQLQTVEVIGRTSKRYHSEYSFGATKTSALNKDIPQAIATVTKELIADRQAFQMADAVKSASGVIPSSFYNQYAIRGISQNEEGQIINGMRTRQYYFLQPLTTNIERIEVIKGPASATFASVDPGGSINLVTKKPLNVNRREIRLAAGSFSTIRGSLDFTGPLNQEKTLLYRLNGAYQEARSYRDMVGNKSFLLSPSFTYLPDQKTAINVELILSNMRGNLDRGQPIFGAIAGVTNLASTPISLNLGAPNDFFQSRDFVITGNLSHKFSKHITLTTSYMKQTWTEDLQEHRTTNAFAVDFNNAPVTSLAAMQFVQRKQFWNIDNLNTYLNFDFETGKAVHKLLIGYDLHSWNKFKGGGQNAARGYLLKDGSVAASFVLANAANYQATTISGKLLPKPNVNHFDLNNPTYTIRNADDYTLNVRTALPAALTTTNAIYIQEQLQWNRFTLLLSLRNEFFRDITNYKSGNPLQAENSFVLPRVGLTYAITVNVNVYGTYLQGFQPQVNTVTLMPNTASLKPGSQFDPLTSDLKEVGLKGGLFNNTIKLNAAVYEINQQNILLNANVPAFPDSLTTRGAERSRGFEMDIAGFLLPNWQINASYSYIDAVILKDNDPSLVETRKQNTPFNSANLWTRYNIHSGSMLGNTGIGLGVQYSGDKVPWFTTAFRVPAYTIFDAAVYYEPGKSNMQLSVNVNNLTNKTYWIGAQNYLRLFPGAPRNIMFTATYKF
ncbi:TonB-dependent receptor [Segetibacter sp. 3557_3]|uniref:TonB-dependent receptor n=1 Tax=Segetibacter sp. 3557_3 TaxID=2547429 RepID=UPI001058C076|nr:TonB-dependent receptor [Segetibacter sp. 3557_3]TDH18398.1 TonB-dependent receptor [Segetibacter sp. 3557_3]